MVDAVSPIRSSSRVTPDTDLPPGGPEFQPLIDARQGAPAAESASLPERIITRTRQEFSDAFAEPLGPSAEFMQPTDALPDYLWPLKALNNMTYRGAVPLADAALRTLQAGYYSGADAVSETAKSIGLVDRGDNSLERDLKLLPEAFAGSPTALLGPVAPLRNGGLKSARSVPKPPPGSRRRPASRHAWTSPKSSPSRGRTTA